MPIHLEPLPPDLRADIDDVNRIAAIPTILAVVCRTTGMGFAAVARVTDDRWIACSVLDEIDFGLKTGGELKVDTTICHEVRRNREPVVIDHVARDEKWCTHPTPLMYGFQSYISMPIVLGDGTFFGTLCAIDPRPAQVERSEIVGMFRLFAELIARHLDDQRKMAEIESALELARSAMEANSDSVSVLDPEGCILSINQNGRRQMDMADFSAAAHQPWPDLWPEPENAKARAALQAAREGRQARFSGRFLTATGTEKYVEVTVGPILDARGRPARILSVARDMTIRRIEEAQLRETARLESLGVLAGGIAHDFNNLLTSILGNASLLQSSADWRDAELASQIVEAAERAADLTQQMLAYSGKGRFIVQRLNLSATVRAIRKLIEASIDKKVELVLSLDEDLPMIEADPAQIQQLVMNLAINAAEAMEGRQGEITISTCKADVDEMFVAQTFRHGEAYLAKGRYAQLEVRDCGSEMSKETLDKIFDPFFTTRFAGRGLGLAAVSGIVRGHGGAVQVLSEPGRGSTFRIFLPAEQNSPRHSESDPAAEREPIQRGWGTILLADDEEVVRRVGRESLERCGYETLLAENGKAALDLFGQRREAIRLVILDVTMPVLNGEEVLARLRDMDPQIPILLSSGYNKADIIERFARQEISGLLQKPYTSAQLSNAVARALA
jgi:PAS domain S-box-containing protein